MAETVTPYSFKLDIPRKKKKEQVCYQKKAKINQKEAGHEQRYLTTATC